MVNDWVHCNYCGCLPDKSARFFLFNCGHVSCQKCTKEGPSKVVNCCLCRKEVKLVEITSKMDTELKLFFSDLTKTQKSIFSEMNKIETFQQQNRQRLMAYKNKQLAKYEGIARTSGKEIAEKDKAIANMSMHIADLEKENYSFISQFKSMRHNSFNHEGTFISETNKF